MSDSNQTGAASDMQNALDNFDTVAIKIIEEGVLDTPEAPEPKNIYHYTTSAGLHGILQNSSLWLSDIFSLNDRYELHHGLNLATEILVNAAKAGPSEYLKFAMGYTELRKEEADAFPHFFVCSFSVRGNDHDQWKTYADDGRGYALDFATNPVKVPFASNGKPEISGGGGFLVKYDDNRLSEICRQLITKALPLTSQIRRNNPWDYAQSSHWSKLMCGFSTHVLHASVYFKDKKYKQEDEFRLFWIQESKYLNGIKDRPGNNESIKYWEFDWKSAGPNVLKSIVIGPAADFEKSKRFAEDCLRESDIDVASVQITQSQIPYKPA